MPSDMTSTKALLFGDPLQVKYCPTCNGAMAVNAPTAQYLVATGAHPAPIRSAEASHLTPSADGGRYVALECNRCNSKRNRAPWAAPDTVERARVVKTKAAREANGRLQEHNERLARLGY